MRTRFTLARVLTGFLGMACATLAAGPCPTVGHSYFQGDNQPYIAAGGGCNVVVTVSTSGTTIQIVNQQPFDGADDQLVGIVNNGAAPLSQITFTGYQIAGWAVDTTIDGLCTFGAGGLAGTTFTSGSSAYCTNAQLNGGIPDAYYGPNMTYSNWASGNSVTVTFNPPIAVGGSTFLSLEQAPSTTLSVLTLTQLSPSSANAGGPQFTLTATGSGFVNGSQLNWNNTPLATSYQSGSQLTAVVPAALIQNATVASITVTNPGSPPVASNSLPFTVSAGVTITLLSPNTISAGSPGFALTVYGSGFAIGDGFTNPNSTVQWNGFGLQTTYISPTQLTAFVPASLLTNPGNISVTVNNSSYTTNAGSNVVTFVITPPLSLISINPNNSSAGGSGGTVTLNGSGFKPGALAYWNATLLPTAFSSPTQLMVQIGPSLLTTPGTFQITVLNPDSAIPSNSLPFLVTAGLTITSLSPTTATAGGSAFTLTVNGAEFVSTSTVQFGATSLLTTYVSSTQLSASVPASLIAAAGTANVTVTNPDGTVSNASSFTISPALSLTSMSPTSATAGDPAFTLTVNGSGFLNGATVQWNGLALSTTFGSATQLTAAVPANLIATAGSASVTVKNSTGPASGTLTFMISAFSITSLNPSSTVAGGSAFTLGVSGSGFQNGATVFWNGAAIPTTFVSATQVTASVSAGLIATAGTASVAVHNPKGSSSNTLTFTINAPVITSLNPTSVVANGPQFTLTVNGTGFLNGATVLWGVLASGSQPAALQTSFLSASQLTAVVPTSLTASAGSVTVSVKNPSGPSSNTQTFSVTIFAITSLKPPSATAGGSSSIALTVTGSGFVSGDVVQWNGTTLANSAVQSVTSMTATVPAALIATAGTANVTVRNQAGNSTPVAAFTITPQPVPPVSFQVKPAVSLSDQPTVGVTLSAAYPTALTGTLSLSFVPAVLGLPPGYIDPAAVFSGGSASQSFTIAAGATTAVIPGNGQFSQGTVAGTLKISISSLTAGGVDVTPVSNNSTQVTIQPAAPVITAASVKILNVSPSGFTVEVQGFSNTRQLSTASFVFTPAAGAALDGSTTFPVSFGASMSTTWFDSPTGQEDGGRFALQVPFTYTGDTSAIGTVSVTLTNSAPGDSGAVSGGQ